MSRVEPGVEELLNPGNVLLRVRAADDGLRHILLTHGRGRLLVVARQRQLLADVARQRGVRPPLARDLPGRLLARRPADGELTVAGHPGAAPSWNASTNSGFGAVL